jgi:hypothetical protein
LSRRGDGGQRLGKNEVDDQLHVDGVDEEERALS